MTKPFGEYLAQEGDLPREHMHLLSYNFGLEKYVGLIVYCGAIVAFFGSFFRPALAMYVLVPLLPFQTVRYRLGSYPLGYQFIDLMLFASLAGSLFRRQCNFPGGLLRVPLIANIVVTYISLWKGAAYLSLPWPIWFDQIRLSNWKDNVVLPVLVFVAVYSAIRTRRQMVFLLVLMCLTMAAFNRNVYNGQGQKEQSSFSYESRAESAGLGANGLAALEVQFGFLLLGIAAFKHRRYLRIPCWAIASFTFYAMMLTYSRGGYVAFIVGWTALGLLKTRKLLIGLVVFMVVWQSVVPNAVRERVLMTYTAEGLESSAAHRVTLWQDAMDVIGIDPILGVGYNTYEFMHREEEINDTHNVYMKVLVEGGAVGLFLFLLVFWRLARVGYSSFRGAQDPFFAGLGLGLLLWMICAFVTNVFGDRWNYITIVGYLWAAAAMVLRGREIERTEAALSAEVDEPQYAMEEA